MLLAWQKKRETDKNVQEAQENNKHLFGEREKTVHNRRNSSHVYFKETLLQIFWLGLEIHYLIPLRISLLETKIENEFLYGLIFILTKL
jgi:hypothetical protein